MEISLNILYNIKKQYRVRGYVLGMKKKKAGIYILTLAIVFIIIGAYRGEIGNVFIKAINICLECIGIG